MSRWEYMRQLEELLSDIPPSEREEALQYYNDYINDGGKENEAEILESLGTPARVAATIKEGLDGTGGEFTEKGFRGAADRTDNTIARYQQPASPQQEREPEKKEGLSGGVVALIVFLCIIFSPAILGLGFSLFALLLSVFFVMFLLVVVFAGTSILLIAAAILSFVIGVAEVVYSPLSGLAWIAAALVTAGVGILFLLLTTTLVGKVIPAMVRGISTLLNRMFGGKGGKK